MDNGITASIECSKCKHNFIVNRDNVIFNRHYKDEKGQSIFLTYFDCPECQERHFVQIDNTFSTDIRRKVQKMFIKFSVMNKQNKSIPKQQQDKFNKLKDNLKKKRFELMKKYDGSEVTDVETDEKVKLNFIIV